MRCEQSRQPAMCPCLVRASSRASAMGCECGFHPRAGGATARPNDDGCPTIAHARGSRPDGRRDHRETRLELAQRIGNAYGLVLILVMITFAVMMTLPPEGWGGRVAAVAVAGLTAIIAFTSSDVRQERVRLAAMVAVAAVVAAFIAERALVRSSARPRVHRRRDPAGDRVRHDPAARHRRREPCRLSHHSRGDQRLRAARPAVCILLLRRRSLERR